MRELNINEIEKVSGAGIIEDIEQHNTSGPVIVAGSQLGAALSSGSGLFPPGAPPTMTVAEAMALRGY